MTTVLQVINLPQFKVNWSELSKKHQLSQAQSDSSLKLFSEILQGQVNYYELGSELVKRLQIDLNKAFALSDEIMALYNKLVPADLQKIVEVKIKRDDSLLPLTGLKVKFSLPALAREAELGDKFLVAGKMPSWPELTFLATSTMTQAEVAALLTTDHNLQSKNFLPEIGQLSQRENRLKGLAATLQNKGFDRVKASDAANQLLKFVEDKARYLLAQKSLQQLVLLDLALIVNKTKKTLTWQLPEALVWLQKNKAKIGLTALNELRKINFIVSNILTAYREKVLAKNGILNENLSNQYQEICNSYFLLLQTKELTADNIKIMADNLLLIMTAMESGLLFTHQD